MITNRDLSIIVPTKNEGHNIERFLHSIPRSVEVILVDASRDQTLELARRLRPDIKVIFKPRTHIARARQIGAKVSTRPWLLFTDCDIHFSPTYFQQLKSLPPAVAYFGSKYCEQPEFEWYDTVLLQSQRFFHTFGIPGATGSNMIVRRESFFAVGGFDLNLICNEDTELFFRLQKAGYRIQFAPELSVISHDDRRLSKGVWRKITHSFLRCSALYFDLLNQRQKQSDWGYWQK